MFLFYCKERWKQRNEQKVIFIYLLLIFFHFRIDPVVNFIAIFVTLPFLMWISCIIFFLLPGRLFWLKILFLHSLKKIILPVEFNKASLSLCLSLVVLTQYYSIVIIKSRPWLGFSDLMFLYLKTLKNDEKLVCTHWVSYTSIIFVINCFVRLFLYKLYCSYMYMQV